MTSIAVALGAILTFSAPSFGAAFDLSDPSPAPSAEADDGEDIYKLAGQEEVDKAKEEGSTTTGDSESTQTVAQQPGGEWVRSTACDTVGAAGCLESYSCTDGSIPVVWTFILDSGGMGDSYSQCPEDPPPTATSTPPVDIPGEALKAFERVELPASRINIQPPGGETLVNFKTILSTQAERHQIPVHLDQVNIDLVLEVWPSNFVWHHGDGTTQASTIAGAMWTTNADVDGPDFITHIYAQAHKEVPVSVDTTWSAQFKVAGEPNWRPVNGTVTKVGEAVPLTVREATPELVTDPG